MPAILAYSVSNLSIYLKKYPFFERILNFFVFSSQKSLFVKREIFVRQEFGVEGLLKVENFLLKKIFLTRNIVIDSGHLGISPSGHTDSVNEQIPDLFIDSFILSFIGIPQLYFESSLKTL